MTRYECGGLPFYVENDLPYPGAFLEESYPRLFLNGQFHAIEHDLILEVPGCFNKIGSPLEDFSGVLVLERSFTFPDKATSGIRRLCFEACFHSAAVSLNNVYLGRSEDPYLPFYFNITDILNYEGENLLRVEIDNRIDLFTLPPKQFSKHKPGWKLYAGLFRDVYIDSLPEIYCFKADIKTCGNEIICDLLFADDSNSVFHFCHKEVIDNERRWSPDSPNLYTMEIRTPFGSQTLRFGFRDISIKDRQIMIDGSPLTIKGVCRHEEHYDYGHALPSSVIRKEIDLIKNLGSNLARLAHYPHSESAYRACDEAGLFVYTETPNYQAGLGIVQGLFGKSAELRKNRFSPVNFFEILRNTGQLSWPKYLKAAKHSLIKLIERERNHPSILFWGLGNECFSYSKKGKQALLSLKETADELDPGRPSVYAAFTAPGISHRYEKALDIFDVICINEYYGWYYGSIYDAKTYWQKIAERHPGKPLILTETGSDSYLDDAKGLEHQCHLLKEHWKLTQNAELTGICVWVLKDFPCPEYGDELPVPGHNAKGLYTRDYKEKPAAAVLRELWR